MIQQMYFSRIKKLFLAFIWRQSTEQHNTGSLLKSIFHMLWGSKGHPGLRGKKAQSHGTLPKVLAYFKNTFDPQPRCIYPFKGMWSFLFLRTFISQMEFA